MYNVHTKMHFIGSKEEKSKMTTLELTKEDCLEMARTKRCDSKNAMKCQ